MAAQNYAGDYQGTLHAGAAELRLVLHLKQGAAGYTASLDSLDQGANGLPVASAVVGEGGSLKLEMPALNGKYDGQFSKDGNAISGTWSQGTALPLNFTKMAAGSAGATSPKPAKPSEIDGTWRGTLSAGGAKLRLVFVFANTAEGIKGTLDSPDQGAAGIPITVSRDGSDVMVKVPAGGAQFKGKLSPDLKTIEGEWSQAGQSMPLVVQRGAGSAALAPRPQDPKKPYPYRDLEVRVPNKSAGIELAGTLTIPEGKGPFPAVVLVTGSGAQNRDEELMGHRPFLVLADYLTRKGIAVLRMDDRGVAQSGGDFKSATTMDFATDAEAGLAFLKTRSEVNPARMGIIGHSEGGLIGPLVASRNPDVAFVVMLAGPGVPGDEIIVEQSLALAKVSGMNAEQLQTTEAKQRQFVKIVKSENDSAVRKQKLQELLGERATSTVLTASDSVWYRNFLNTDPAPYLRRVKCPVLALIGSKDLQVPPAENLPAIRAALTAGGNKDFEVVEMPGLNHLFQTAGTGAVTEYATIDETMAPAVLEKVSAWVLRH